MSEQELIDSGAMYHIHYGDEGKYIVFVFQPSGHTLNSRLLPVPGSEFYFVVDSWGDQIHADLDFPKSYPSTSLLFEDGDQPIVSGHPTFSENLNRVLRDVIKKIQTV